MLGIFSSFFTSSTKNVEASSHQPASSTIRPTATVLPSQMAIPVSPAPITNVAAPASQQDVRMLSEGIIMPASEQSPLQRLVVERDQLIAALREKPGYHLSFELILQDLAPLSDDKLNIEDAIHYTQRINILLQKILAHPVFFAKCMEMAIGSAKSGRIPDSLFIHSQAAKILFTCEDAALLIYTAPYNTYQELITYSKHVLAWESLADFTNSHMKEMRKQGRQAGERCLYAVSILYHAQARLEKDGYESLIKIVPLDPLVEIEESVIQQAIEAAKTHTKDLPSIISKLYPFSFWQLYMLGGYKDDPTIKGTPLEAECQWVEKMRMKGPEEKDSWRQDITAGTLEEAFEVALQRKFRVGLKRTLGIPLQSK